MRKVVIFAVLFAGTLAAGQAYGWVGAVATLGIGGIAALGVMRSINHAGGGVSLDANDG